MTPDEAELVHEAIAHSLHTIADIGDVLVALAAASKLAGEALARVEQDLLGSRPRSMSWSNLALREDRGHPTSRLHHRFPLAPSGAPRCRAMKKSKLPASLRKPIKLNTTSRVRSHDVTSEIIRGP